MQILRAACIGLLALMAAACTSYPSGVSTPSSAKPPQSASGGSSKPLWCNPGEKVNYSAQAFHFDVTLVESDATVDQLLSRYQDVGAAALPIYKSSAKRYAGQAFVVFHFNANVHRLPPSLPFLHYTICAGMAKVEGDGQGRSKVIVPVQGGSRPGQVSVLVPRDLYTKMTVAFVPCIEIVGVPTVDNPDIKHGPYAHNPNVQCNKGSGEPGVSHAMQRMRDGRPGELYVFIVKRSRGS